MATAMAMARVIRRRSASAAGFLEYAGKMHSGNECGRTVRKDSVDKGPRVLGWRSMKDEVRLAGREWCYQGLLGARSSFSGFLLREFRIETGSHGRRRPAVSTRLGKLPVKAARNGVS